MLPITDEIRARIQQQIAGWKTTDLITEAERRRDLPLTNAIEMIGHFDGFAASAIKNFPPQPTSGMVEMQRCFTKWRRQLEKESSNCTSRK